MNSLVLGSLTFSSLFAFMALKWNSITTWWQPPINRDSGSGGERCTESVEENNSDIWTKAKRLGKKTKLDEEADMEPSGRQARMVIKPRKRVLWNRKHDGRPNAGENSV